MYNLNMESEPDSDLPLRELVFNTIKSAILSGKISPGERLLENHIAEKLGVSRTPVREALRMLQTENLVRLIPRKGAQVLEMGKKDIKDVLEVRSALEALSVSLACTRMTLEELEKLKEQQKRFIKSCQGSSYEEMCLNDELFHDIIFKASRNEKLSFLFSNLRMQLYRYRLAYFKSNGLQNIAISQHEEIIKAISSHNVSEGTRTASNHINFLSNVLLKYLDSK